MRDAPELLERARELTGRRLTRVRLVTDTTEFMKLESGDVLELEGRRFVLKGTEYEGRFGLDEQPKYWVKRALDWEDGSAKIIKLVFFEEFEMALGAFKVRCFRSPAKEARILALVRGNPNFMQGESLQDTAGNQVRVLDRIHGGPLDHHLQELECGHQEYFERHLRRVLTKLSVAFGAIGWLHTQGERHGDVRRDHLFVDTDSGAWPWIDFDYNFEFKQNPYGLDLFGLGNVLAYAVARRDVTYQLVQQENPQAAQDLRSEDFSLIIKNRLMNLRKIYPYLPASLNNVLLHFSSGATVFYERVDELMAELTPAIAELPEEED
ncbi:MAG: hypothetical protein KJ720_03525 [Proteobacteria bacterium]|nr:hypothetical protein [Pseudomonadota bacterium]MBU1450392.1 hypothetical protein [Pseudomonadota bacterium]MBU2467386.1 hypothetical protein [Pseudomonadota bacterium]MBU2516483.1 hypothetical protein [Pseudomonadota bacterium]